LPGNSSGHKALALAKCAAAAVDGFTAQEVLLHPLLAMPLDVTALQVMPTEDLELDLCVTPEEELILF
jgi:hypothetical protein